LTLRDTGGRVRSRELFGDIERLTPKSPCCRGPQTSGLLFRRLWLRTVDIERLSLLNTKSVLPKPETTQQFFQQ